MKSNDTTREKEEILWRKVIKTFFFQTLSCTSNQIDDHWNLISIEVNNFGKFFVKQKTKSIETQHQHWFFMFITSQGRGQHLNNNRSLNGNGVHFYTKARKNKSLVIKKL